MVKVVTEDIHARRAQTVLYAFFGAFSLQEGKLEGKTVYEAVWTDRLC